MSEEPIKGRIFNPDPVIYTAKTVVPCTSCAALRARVECMEKVVATVEELRFAWGCFCGRHSEKYSGTTKHTDQCNQVVYALAAFSPEKAKSEGGI